MVLQSNNHSVFALNYHLILVIKNRQEVIDEAISNRLREIFERIQNNYNIVCQEWNHDIDHIHILFSAEPNTELSKFINAYKSASSRLIKKEFPKIKTFLEKDYFWSKSFCLFNSINEAMEEAVKKFIENQKEKR